MRVPRLLVLCLLAACKSRGPADAGTRVVASPRWLEGRLPEDDARPEDGGQLVVRLPNEPASLNYLDNASHDASVQRMVGRLVLESLLEIDPRTYELRPALATSWNETADHLTTTFHLRETTFSNGEPFTADDVAATLEQVRHAPHCSAMRAELSTLSGWKVDDAHTIELRWSTPSVFALRTLATVPILSRGQLAGAWAGLGARPIGTGPYALVDWQRGVSLTLHRREGAPAHLDSIVFRFVKDPTAAATLFERGEFDLMTLIPPSLWRALEKDDPSTDWARRDWNRVRSTDNTFSYIAWNEAVPALADVRVRRAFAALYDAKLITRVVDQDLEVPTVCPWLSGSDSCSPRVQRIPFSVEDARAELEDAGFVDADDDGIRARGSSVLRFQFLLPSSSVRLGKLVPLLQEQFRAAGVELDVERVETTTLSARTGRRDFEVVSRAWTEFDREQSLFAMFHSSQADGGSNFAGYASPEADRLIEAIRGEFDVGKRRALEQALHERIYADQPYLLMTHRQSLDAAKKRVHGLAPSVVWYDLRAVWVSH